MSLWHCTWLQAIKDEAMKRCVLVRFGRNINAVEGWLALLRLIRSTCLGCREANLNGVSLMTKSLKFHEKLKERADANSDGEKFVLHDNEIGCSRPSVYREASFSVRVSMSWHFTHFHSSSDLAP
jgi:hypothetical protein